MGDLIRARKKMAFFYYEHNRKIYGPVGRGLLAKMGLEGVDEYEDSLPDGCLGDESVRHGYVNGPVLRGLFLMGFECFVWKRDGNVILTRRNYFRELLSRQYQEVFTLWMQGMGEELLRELCGHLEALGGSLILSGDGTLDRPLEDRSLIRSARKTNKVGRPAVRVVDLKKVEDRFSKVTEIFRQYQGADALAPAVSGHCGVIGTQEVLSGKR